MNFRILYISEIVGKSGLFAVKKLLPGLRAEFAPDFVIAEADSVTNCAGLGKNHSVYLRKLGIDVLTTGECAFYKKDMVESFPKSPWVLRPANLPLGNPGRGYKIYEAAGKKIAVASILGQAGFTRIHPGNPFSFLLDLAERISREADYVIADFHAQATAEKYTMLRLMDGKLHALLGSHAKALTSDDHVTPKGTAFICDTGRTGAIRSVGGQEAALRIKEYLSGIPEWSKESWDSLELQGVIIDIDRETGKTVSITRLRRECTEAADARDRNGDVEGREDGQGQTGNP